MAAESQQQHHHRHHHHHIPPAQDQLDHLFPRCRLRASPSVDTAVLIDLSDDGNLLPPPPPPPKMTQRPDTDSDASPLRRPPSLVLGQQQRRFGPPAKYRTESSELRRSKLRRPRTLDSWMGLQDAYGGGYEPSSDSEENDSDCPPTSKSAGKRTTPPATGETGGGGGGVRSSASESHMVGQWKKTGGSGEGCQSRHRSVKEIYDLTPTRVDLNSSPLAGLVDAANTRLEIAGGREIVSRTRTRASQRKRHSASHMSTQQPDSPPSNNNNNNSTASSSTRSINRYSGEVYYEESVGRYGFHVGGGNTLWGSQGLEPSFSIPGCLNEKQPGPSASVAGERSALPHGQKRPLSWAGDDGPDSDQQQLPQQEAGATTGSPGSGGYGSKQSPEEMKSPPSCNGRLLGTEEASVTAPSSKAGVRGYLADFYPEVVLAESHESPSSASDAFPGQEPCPINLDNYLSEQLNQFALQSASTKKGEGAGEPEEIPPVSAPAVLVPPPSQQQLTVATVIGGLTIAQYEGSPRRYGVRPYLPSSNSQDEETKPSTTTSTTTMTKPSVNGPASLAPRSVVPGFPRRVAPSPAQLAPQPTFSPSATRQTLVDLTRSPGSAGKQPVVVVNQHSLPWHLEPDENTMTTTTITTSGNHHDADPADVETDLGETEVGLEVGKSRNFTLSPETTDYDDSELDNMHPDASVAASGGMSGSDNSPEPGNGSAGRRGSNKSTTNQNGGLKGQFSSMPILEDGLSSGQSGSDASASEDDDGESGSGGGGSGSESEEDARIPLMTDSRPQPHKQHQQPHRSSTLVNNGCLAGSSPRPSGPANHHKQQLWVKKLAIHSECDHLQPLDGSAGLGLGGGGISTASVPGSFRARDATPPPPAPMAHRPLVVNNNNKQQQPRLLSPGPETPSSTPVSGGTMSKSSPVSGGGELNLRELDEALEAQHSRARKASSMPPSTSTNAPVWVPRQSNNDYWVKSSPPMDGQRVVGNKAQADKVHGGGGGDEEEERETDQLLRDPDDQGFFDAPVASSCAPPTRGTPPTVSTATSSTHSSPQQMNGSGTALAGPAGSRQSEPRDLKYRDATSSAGNNSTPTSASKNKKDDNSSQSKKKGRSKEVMVHEPAVLIEGVLFRANYLGSTQIVCEGQPTKYTRMMQAEEAVSRIKAPEGETQPTTEVDLFISTEKIMVLNTELKEIMMDHALRTISYIADIGDLVVLMARRRMMTQDGEDPSNKIAKTPKMVCHVFESEEAQFIAQSIGQAFQVAYMEFLKANGIEDQSFVREMDYQEVLNSQEIFGDELQMFAKKELQKEVIVPKARNEILGVVIVESGWGSMLPTVVIANLAPAGAAARCGQLNIGDQIIAINGISLVGLPLSTCQTYIKNAKSATVVKLTVVPCPPVVEVKIKRPDTKYQLGFSVQNGVICSLLRGGIAERGGVRVGHRIIEINGQSVVAVPHERIVGLLATSVGEINMKTMPTSMFRLLIGQETPVYI